MKLIIALFISVFCLTSIAEEVRTCRFARTISAKLIGMWVDDSPTKAIRKARLARIREAALAVGIDRHAVSIKNCGENPQGLDYEAIRHEVIQSIGIIDNYCSQKNSN